MKTTDDVLVNKAGIIERCLRRAQQEYSTCPSLDNFTHVDAMLLNLERACQAAVDMAMHVIATRRLGVPQSAASAFDLLDRAALIDTPLASSMKGMVGFRNILVHEYEKLDMTIVRHVMDRGIRDFVHFCQALGLRVVVDPQG